MLATSSLSWNAWADNSSAGNAPRNIADDSTLGLLRPSSAATKEKQEQERLARGEANAPQQPQYHRQQEKPKIVWFKPTDKRVPLIAIPTEQAPRDFVENHGNYANTLFVAAIKRWPITSLHPFGTLVEELGSMGDVEVESEAILRDNNITNEKFGENLLASIPDDDSVVTQAVAEDAERRDLRKVTTFTIDPVTARELDDAISLDKSEDGKTAELGVHIADVSYFVRPNSLADREARKRATSVYLVQRAVSMLPEKLSQICSLEPGVDRLSISVVFTISLDDATLGTVNNVWMGRSVIQSKAKLSYDLVQKLIDGEKTELTTEEAGSLPPKELLDDILLLHRVTSKFRANRFDDGALAISASPLRLVFSLDDEQNASPNVTGCNVFESTPAMQLIEELMLKANFAVAERIRGAWGGEGAFLRRHDVPLERRFNHIDLINARLEGFIRRCQRLGISMDVGEDGRGLMKALMAVSDNDIRTVHQGEDDADNRHLRLFSLNPCNARNTLLQASYLKTSIAITHLMYRSIHILPRLSADTQTSLSTDNFNLP
jgi:protein SSD1